jgi:sec-independent protein translocase protein TatB
MEILGIGPAELVFIVLLALIILGPRDMQSAGRTLGRWLRQVVTSDSWKFFQQTSREIQTLPNRLMREAAIEELQRIERAAGLPGPEQIDATTRRAENGARSAPAPDRGAEPRILPGPATEPPHSDPEKDA